MGVREKIEEILNFLDKKALLSFIFLLLFYIIVSNSYSVIAVASIISKFKLKNIFLFYGITSTILIFLSLLSSIFLIFSIVLFKKENLPRSKEEILNLLYNYKYSFALIIFFLFLIFYEFLNFLNSLAYSTPEGFYEMLSRMKDLGITILTFNFLIIFYYLFKSYELESLFTPINNFFKVLVRAIVALILSLIFVIILVLPIREALILPSSPIFYLYRVIFIIILSLIQSIPTFFSILIVYKCFK